MAKEERTAGPATREELKLILHKLDKKFYGRIFKVKDSTLVPDDQYVVFLAKDNAFAKLIEQYPQICEELGCDAKQVEMAKQVVENVKRWRGEHEDLCKNPDAEGERVIGDTFFTDGSEPQA